jgi:hypothetical protein
MECCFLSSPLLDGYYYYYNKKVDQLVGLVASLALIKLHLISYYKISRDFYGIGPSSFHLKLMLFICDQNLKLIYLMIYINLILMSFKKLKKCETKRILIRHINNLRINIYYM